MHEHDNPRDFVAFSRRHTGCLWDQPSSKNGVLMEIRRQAWHEEPIINSSHHPRRWEEPSSSSILQSEVTSKENIIKNSIYLDSKLLPYFSYVNTLYMCSSRLKHSQYSPQRVVASFGDQIQYYNEWGFCYISRAVSYLASTGVVGHEVQRNITTGMSPYEEWSKEWPWPDEGEW